MKSHTKTRAKQPNQRAMRCSKTVKQPRQFSAYICGPLTELPQEAQEPIKLIYSLIGDLCQQALGIRGFVPHEHNDPVRHAKRTPKQVDRQERCQVTTSSSCLILLTIAPSWGGGIEAEMANNSGVPIILLRQNWKQKPRRVSRLLLGNPAVKAIVNFETYPQLFKKLQRILPKIARP